MPDLLAALAPHLLVALHLVVACVASAHVLLHKRNPRAATGWVGIIFLTPFLGSLLYVLFGVNRVRRRAMARRPPVAVPVPGLEAVRADDAGERPAVAHLGTLVRLAAEVTRRPLLRGNLIAPLATGEEAFAAMIDAIDRAERSVGLSTYIFDHDRAGTMFLEALAGAVARGVEVRVLIDDVGSRYSWPSMVRALQRRGVATAKFMPTAVPWRFLYSNLRNHRKILVVDGAVGFTGGMNIREGVLADATPRHRLNDLHFRLRGPVVGQLREVFADDWSYTTGETLDAGRWLPALAEAGPVWARAVVDGPDDDLDKLRMVLLGAASCATSSLVVLSPYFIPDDALLTALNVAAMRGVTVDIVMPAVNNLTLVAWASTTQWPWLLEHGCRIWLSRGCFDHTKLMLVDDAWTLLGSANWDSRSLRLNFELDVECYDAELTGSLRELVAAKLEGAHRVTLPELRARPLAARLRDGVVHLASPYL